MAVVPHGLLAACTTRIAIINNPLRHIVCIMAVAAAAAFPSSSYRAPFCRRTPCLCCVSYCNNYGATYAKWYAEMSNFCHASSSPPTRSLAVKTLCIFQLITIIELWVSRGVRGSTGRELSTTTHFLWLHAKKVQGHFQWGGRVGVA